VPLRLTLTTDQPRATALRATADPTKPLPPKMQTFMGERVEGEELMRVGNLEEEGAEIDGARADTKRLAECSELLD